MKFFTKIPIPRYHGPYLAHKVVYEAVGGGRPLWRQFDDHAIVLSDKPHPSLASKAYDPCPRPQQRVRIDLFAEISKADGKPPPGGRAPRIDPVLHAWIQSGKKASWWDLGLQHGAAWLEKKQQGVGFEIQQIDLAEYSTLEFMRNAQPIRLGAITYSAIVKVSDADKFRAAMLNGVGHGKAWGLGLLICNRINT